MRELRKSPVLLNEFFNFRYGTIPDNDEGHMMPKARFGKVEGLRMRVAGNNLISGVGKGHSDT